MASFYRQRKVDEKDLLIDEAEIEALINESGTQKDNLDLLRDPRLMAEIPEYSQVSEDPVRLYLKEIGSIALLTPDGSSGWLLAWKQPVDWIC